MPTADKMAGLKLRPMLDLSTGDTGNESIVVGGLPSDVLRENIPDA